MENTVKSLKARCALIGTDLTKVCREAGVTRTTLRNWEKAEPKSFRALRRIQEVIEKKEKEAQANADTAAISE